MRVTCYHRTGDPALSAWAEGAGLRGHRVTILPGKYWKPGELDAKAEAVIVVGLHGSARQLRDLYVGRGVPVWVMDLPRLRAIGALAGFTLNTLHWLPDAPYGATPKTPGVLKGRTAERVLVVGQKPNDAAHGLDHVELEEWARQTITDLRAVTDLPIHYRMHPLAHGFDRCGADAVDTSATIRDALADCAAVVTYNSTVGWDAIDAGVPVIACAPHEMVGYRDYVAMGLPATLPTLLPAAKRKEALTRVARTCWTEAQLADGTAADAMLGAALALVEAA